MLNLLSIFFRGEIIVSKVEKILNKQIELNETLANILARDDIKSFKLTSVGNSIGSGYSMVRSIKPLLLRNETILSIMQNHDIVLVRKHFARAQNNNDEHIFSWITNNIKETQMHKMNRVDYSDGPTKMPGKINGLNSQLMDEYYPLDIKNDVGLNDVILESDANLANIVIYNGCTGSFLDNVTRNGKLSQKLTYGVKRDIHGLEATLKYIQSSNRNNNTNTQVYICGAPNYLGLGISNIINNKLKRIAQEYANASYVEPVKSKLLYKQYNLDRITNLDEAQSFIKKFLCIKPDPHYDEMEYLKFNNNIIEAINNNYSINKSMINVDRDLFAFSSKLELDSSHLVGNDNYIQSVVNTNIINQYSNFSDEEQKSLFVNKVKKYLIERAPYDFYYIGKENIRNGIDDTPKDIKVLKY